jgi:CheY-like chemotaxis protein
MNTPKKRILIIDDEAAFARLLQLNLNHTGRYEAQAETHSVLALKTALDFSPDLILLDVMMPGMDGGDVKAQLESNPRLRHVPVVFLTAAVQNREVSSSGGHIGGLEFLAKPIDLPHLLNCLEDHLAPATPACTP